MASVLIVNTGLSNLRSITRAVEECGSTPVVSEEPRDLARASHVILPGVGAFPSGMEKLRESGMDEGLTERAEDGLPLLGVCLGMQLLASRGQEVRVTKGLGLIPGEVRALERRIGERVPHIGWDEVDLVRESALFEGIDSGRDFYFVHSWMLVADSADDIVATTPSLGTFISAVARGNVFGVQFHPEKSQRAGLQLLSNFLAL